MIKKSKGSLFKKIDSVMTVDSSVTFRKIQLKYTSDYLPLLDAMIRRVGKTNSQPLMEIRTIVQEVIQDLGKLMSGKAQRGAQEKLIKKVLNNVEGVDKQLIDYKVAASKTDKVSNAIARAEKKSGVRLDDLGKDQKAVSRSLKATKPKSPGFVEQLKGMAPEAFLTGEDLTKGLAQAVLGPFAGIAGLAGSAGVGIFKGVKTKMMERKERKVSDALRPTSTKLTPDVQEEIAKLEKSGTSLGKIFKPGQLASATTGSEQEIATKVASPISFDTPLKRVARPVGTPSSAEMPPKTVKNLVKPLEHFFDKVAYKAK